MVDREDPCARGLTQACFEEHPKWARQAFAYRLMHALCPARITGRLPGKMGEPLIGPGAIIPPDIVIPPGVVVPPGYEWPPLWTPWDPLPEGVLPPPVPPDDIPDGGAVPPIYVPPWEPGPPHRPSPSPPVAAGWISYWGTTYWRCGINCTTVGATLKLGSQWNAVACRIHTEPNTWEDGFRPTHLRLTWTGYTPIEIRFRDKNDSNIVVQSAAESLMEIEITGWGTEDMENIYFWYTPAGEFVNLSNIEFFV